MNILEFSDVFGANYSGKISDGAGLEGDYLAYPGALPDACVDGLGVEFKPQSGRGWYGTFSEGRISKNSINYAGSCPDRESALIVSRGEGYIVKVSRPEEWSEVPIRPIMGQISCPIEKVSVLWCFTRAICLDEKGIRWCTGHISWDGIRDVGLRDGEVFASIWDAPNEAWVSASVNVRSGLVTGGRRPGSPLR